MSEEKKESWAEVVGPIVAKLQVTHAFDKQVTFNAKGAINLARLMASMARRLDNAPTVLPLKPIQEMTQEEFDGYVTSLKAKRGVDNLS